jgi:hypothetical protein
VIDTATRSDANRVRDIRFTLRDPVAVLSTMRAEIARNPTPFEAATIGSRRRLE